MMDFMLDSLNAAVHTHGEGTVISILQSLQWAHVVKLETTGHGVFAKMLYRQGSSSRRKIFLQSLVAPPLPVGLPPRPPTDGTVLEAELHEADESWDHFLSRESSLVASPHVHEDTICKNLDCGGQPVRKLSLDQEFTAMCKEDNVARERRFVENQYDRSAINAIKFDIFASDDVCEVGIQTCGEWEPLNVGQCEALRIRTWDHFQVHDRLRALESVRTIDEPITLLPGETFTFLGVEEEVAKLEYSHEDMKRVFNVPRGDISKFESIT